MRRSAPLYVLSIILVAILISGWSREGFGEFIGIYFIPFLIFLGGILEDAVYFLISRQRSA